MAIIIRDSFDFSASGADAGANFWDTFNNGTQVVFQKAVTRMGQGQAVRLRISARDTVCTKSFGNETTVLCAFAMYPPTLGADNRDFGIVFQDGTTTQLTVIFTDAGSIEVWQGADPNGGSGGTLLAKYLYTHPGNAWTHFQVKAAFNGTTGEVRIRKNGNTSDDYAVTGVNTIKTANAYANKFAMVWGWTSGGGDRYIDDLAVWDTTGSAPWNDWVGDVRAVQVMPSADTAQKNFTGSPSTVLFGSNGTGNTWNNTSGELAFSPFTATAGGVLGTSVTVHQRTAMTGNMVIGLYDSDGPNGQPGTRLAYSTAITNPGVGDTTFTLGNAVNIVSGRNYYWMFEWSASSGQLEIDNGAGFNWYIYNPGYTTTPPSSVASQTFSITNARRATCYATITTTNSGLVSELVQDGSTTFVSDDTVGDFDLYDTSGLTVTPTAILGVSVRALVSKSDAGARSGAVTIKSGSTSVDSSALVLSTSFLNLVMYQDTDPNTGVTWTASGFNSAQLGPKVAA